MPPTAPANLKTLSYGLAHDPVLAEEQVDVASEEMLVNMGPQHPSTHGVLRIELRTDGELVLHATPPPHQPPPRREPLPPPPPPPRLPPPLQGKNRRKPRLLPVHALHRPPRLPRGDE